MGDTRNPVVVGVDGSPPSREALGWAANEASSRELPLRVLHAVSSAEPARWTAARAMIAEAVARARALQPGLTVCGEVIDGRATTELCAASDAAELVVVASRGRGGFEGLLLGSVSLRVAMRARSAVAVVQGVSEDGIPVVDGQEDRALPVLVGVDSSPESEQAIRVGFAEAAARGATLVAIRAWRQKPTVDRSTMEIAAQYAVNQALARWRKAFPTVRTETRILTAGAAAALVEASRAAQLVVVGAKGNARHSGPRLGTTTEQLLHHVHCPIMIVRGQPCATGQPQSSPG
jgi:nucleotide-binding universal stress UspA family protein